MATTVGNEGSIEKLIEDLIYLEHDAIAAYDATTEKLENPAFKAQVTAFRHDHTQHLTTLTTMAQALRIEAPKGGDIKRILTTGKIAIAGLMGDEAILKAMKTNEDDTVAAYERASNHSAALERSKVFFSKALADERRHRQWMQETAATYERR